MPTFEFTSPTGETFTGEGASAEDAFKVAAERTRRAATRGAPAPEYEPSEATQAVKRGEYGPLVEAAGSSAGALASAAAPVASLLGRAMAPTATAEESKFPFISDPKERQAADLAYGNIKEYSTDPKTGRKIPDREKTAASRNKFFAEQQSLTRERAEQLAAETEWEAKQKPALEKLSPEEKSIYESISVPGNPGMTRQRQGEFLRDVAEARKQLSMSWAEKHPQEMEELQVAAAGLSTLGPVYQAWRRARGLTKSAQEAEKAFQRAIKTKAPKGAKEEMAWRANVAEELDKVNDPGFLKAVAKSALTGGLVSGAATQMPNFVDVARLPEESEGRAHAMRTLVSPEQWGRAAAEGAVGAGAGRGLVEKFGSLPAARARNKSILQTIRDKQAAEAAGTKRKATAREQPKSLSDQLRNNDVLAPQADALGPDVTRGAMKRAQMFPE